MTTLPAHRRSLRAAESASLRRQNPRAASPAGVDSKIGVGVWIDRQRAAIVFVAHGETSTTLVLSHVDKQPGRLIGLRSSTRFEPQLVPADDSRERRLTRQLNVYYDAVIACLRGAQAVLIFGPGEAKGELRKRLALVKHDPRSVSFEIADKMTARQIEARARQWLAETVAAPTVARRRSGRPVR